MALTGVSFLKSLAVFFLELAWVQFFLPAHKDGKLSLRVIFDLAAKGTPLIILILVALS